MLIFFNSRGTSELIHHNIKTYSHQEQKALHFNDFFSHKQLSFLKIKPFTNFGSSTHYIEKMWCVEVIFIIASYYVPLSPLANQVYVNS